MGKKYKAVYADPPWAYKVYSKKGEGRSAENHYHTMDIEEIRSLPVESIADDDCILFFVGDISLPSGRAFGHEKLGVYLQDLRFQLG